MIAGPMMRALRPRRKEASTRGPAGAAFAAGASRARPGAGWARADPGPATPGPTRIKISGRIWARMTADSNTGPAAILGPLETAGGLMREADPRGAEGRAMTMQNHIREVLAGIGEDPDREGLQFTPKLGEKALNFLTRCSTQVPKPRRDSARFRGS